MENRGSMQVFRRARLKWVLVGSIIVTILAVNINLAFRSITDLSQRHQRVINTGNVIVALQNLHQAVLSVESGQRGFLMTENEEYLTYYYEALSTLNAQIAVAKALRPEIPEQDERLVHLLNLINLKSEEITATVNSVLNSNSERAQNIILTGTGLGLYHKIHEAIEVIKANEFALQAQLYEQTLKTQDATRVQFIVFSVISVLLVIGGFVLLRVNARREELYLQALEEQNQALENTVAERTRELQLYSEELSRSNRELEDFAFVASHDLQEPLRKIQAFSSRIKSSYQDAIDDRGVDYLDRMNNAAMRMSNLIGDLLEFSRIKTRGKPFEKVDLNKIVDTVLDDIEVSIDESSAVIEVDPLPIIEGDASQMSQLFQNLLSNAVKFRRADERPLIQITYSMEAEKSTNAELDIEWHVLHVIDNGIGFSQDYASKIFQPFQRLHGKDEYKGTGIGLAVCRRIVERHGGSISVISTVGKGTDFAIRIPVEAVNFDRTVKE